VSEFFYNLGRQLGRKVVPAFRKSKLYWAGLAGTEEESLRAEIELGSALANELRAVTQPANDLLAASLVNDLCQRLSGRIRDNHRVFRCELIQDSSPNALALPGGFLFISNSLVNFCERHPDELAFVLGHEMAHIIRRHVWERMLNEAALRMASVVAARAGALGHWFRGKGMGFLRSAYSRDSELEADELGLRLAAAAGFAPSRAIIWLQRIEGRERDPAEVGNYFDSHPAPSERITRLALLVRQLESGAGGEVKRGEGG
jgi:predicted Zn-dependent protease